MEIKEIKFNSINLKGVAKVIKDKYILIELANNEEEVGYIELDFREAKKVTLEAIYCTEKYRNHGIGTTLLDISDALLKDYTGYTLCGEYFPAQMLDDVAKRKSDEELDKAARNFYIKHGFEITSYKEYIANTNNYPEINIDDFKRKNKRFGRSVVYKKISEKTKYRFVDNEDTIIEDSAYKIRGSI